MGGAKVTMTDIAASNGIIHVIDAVLLLGGGARNLRGGRDGGWQLHDAADGAGSAELTATLSGDGSFTVFAPTGPFDALEASAPGTIAAVLADKELLTKILLYHVVDGEVPASEVVTKSSVMTKAGLELTVEVVGSDVFVGGAKVTMTDIAASNGIIHVIDAVLLPPSS
ncbi:MAG: fasciclin domain-containing protein [Deltaproteobacteria bacterium]|nr:fasciclin domain-containing protein [Deltaproteobacteria bacterium]